MNKDTKSASYVFVLHNTKRQTGIEFVGIIIPTEGRGKGRKEGERNTENN